MDTFIGVVAIVLVIGWALYRAARPRRTPRFVQTQRPRGRTVWGRNDSNHITRAQDYGVPWERIYLPAVFIRDDWTCQLCGGSIDPESTYPDPMMPSLDHIVPLSHRYTPGHVSSNVQASHLRCNLRKGDRV